MQREIGYVSEEEKCSIKRRRLNREKRGRCEGKHVRGAAHVCKSKKIIE